MELERIPLLYCGDLGAEVLNEYADEDRPWKRTIDIDGDLEKADVRSVPRRPAMQMLKSGNFSTTRDLVVERAFLENQGVAPDRQEMTEELTRLRQDAKITPAQMRSYENKYGGKR